MAITRKNSKTNKRMSKNTKKTSKRSNSSKRNVSKNRKVRKTRKSVKVVKRVKGVRKMKGGNWPPDIHIIAIITKETISEAFNKFNLNKAFNEEKNTHTLISLDTGNKYTLFLVKKTIDSDITEVDYVKLLAKNNNNKADNYYGLKAPPKNYISFKTINTFINSIEPNILTAVLKTDFLERLALKQNLPEYLKKFLNEQNSQSKTPSPTPSTTPSSPEPEPTLKPKPPNIVETDF